MKISLMIAAGALAMGLSVGASAQTAGQDMKSAGSDTKNAAKDTEMQHKLEALGK